MDITNFVQPTTIIGLAAIAILAVVYVTLQFTKILERKDTQFTSYVETNNHQKTELVQESTKAIVEASENIKNNTEAVKTLINLHLNK